MRGNVMVVAMRDIAVGEELTYDYAMSDGSDYDEFECALRHGRRAGARSPGTTGCCPSCSCATAATSARTSPGASPTWSMVGAERRAFAL